MELHGKWHAYDSSNLPLSNANNLRPITAVKERQLTSKGRSLLAGVNGLNARAPNQLLPAQMSCCCLPPVWRGHYAKRRKPRGQEASARTKQRRKSPILGGGRLRNTRGSDLLVCHVSQRSQRGNGARIQAANRGHPNEESPLACPKPTLRFFNVPAPHTTSRRRFSATPSNPVQLLTNRPPRANSPLHCRSSIYYLRYLSLTIANLQLICNSNRTPTVRLLNSHGQRRSTPLLCRSFSSPS